MTTVLVLHRQAMDLADAAIEAKRLGDEDRFKKLSGQAFIHERQAAEMIAGDLDAEPTRSVLHRSAASLALDIGDHRSAERLIAVALAGNPPEEIAEELRDLSEQVYFQRHLELRKITLEPEEVQISISGKSIGFGIAQGNEVMDRVRNIEKMIYRIVQRKMGKQFQGQGRRSTASRENYEVYMSVPRAASFAVSLKIGRPEKTENPQGKFSGMEPAVDVLNEMVACLDLVSHGDEKALRDKIPDDLYYENFVQLARQIAPDGKNVSQVGITVLRGGKERSVAFQRHREQIPVLVRPSLIESDGKEVQVTGYLKFADSISKESSVKLVEKDSGKIYTVFVRESMMSDIVRPLYEDMVVVTGSRTPKGILLKDIKKADD